MAINASYLAHSSAGGNTYLYAISESGENSAISAFVDNSTTLRDRCPDEWEGGINTDGRGVNRAGSGGTIDLINSRSDIGKDPCYLTWYDGFLITANYSGGSFTIFPTDRTGAIRPPVITKTFIGSGPVGKRQLSSHIHTVRVLRRQSNEQLFDYLVATDLGSDKFYLYKVTRHSCGTDSITIVPNSPSSISVKSGSGPRHIDFNADGTIMYLLNELSGYLNVYKIENVINPRSGNREAGLGKKNYHEVPDVNFKLIQSVANDTTGAQACGDIHISPDGHSLYASNRRQNDGIQVYKIEKEGKLVKTQYFKTAKHPRNFIILPSGETMLVASKEERLIQIVKINAGTGKLSDTGHIIKFETEEPVCIIPRKYHY